jgi:ATP-dependent DNA helicase RecG
MQNEKIEKLLPRGEGIDIEFKKSLFKLNRNVFETVCAFLNRKGGNILLGINDSGEVEGIAEGQAQQIIDSLITTANNPQKLNPPYYLSANALNYHDKKIIHCYVPESSQVHRVDGRIFDRNEDGDFDITDQTEQVTQLYLRKKSTFSENDIYPYVKISDFRKDLFHRIRQLAKNERPDHPWGEMNNKELLRSAGLYKHDLKTGKKGYTMAAILLVGRDEIIQDVLPHYKTDAIVRIENKDRYDDRDVIRTNLIESYDRLMNFVRKHLPDKFYQEAGQRISLRDLIYREIVVNLLVHREFTNAYPAKFIIEEKRIMTENWNRPHGNGMINPLQFSPFPKNPSITRFFKELGRVEELGSGIRNTFKYLKRYVPGAKPQFIEDDIFRAVLPLAAEEISKNNDKKMGENIRKEEKLPKNDAQRMIRKVRRKFGERFGESSEKILKLIYRDSTISAVKMADEIGLTSRAVEKKLAKLKEGNIVKRIGPPKGGKWEINI